MSRVESSNVSLEFLYTTTSTRQLEFSAQLHQFYLNHLVDQKLLQQKLDNATTPDCTCQDGLLLYCTHLFIPLESELRAILLGECHDSLLGGHSGIKGTLNRLFVSFAWLNMARDVCDHICACTNCQQNKYSTQK